MEEIISTGFELKVGHIFIVEAGIGKYAENSKYNQISPVPSKEVIDWFIKNRIISYMTHATLVDPFGSKDSPNHHKQKN